MRTINNRELDRLSDTILYAEACTFAKENPPPSNKQVKYLEGLAMSSKSWQGLIDYINHQKGRDIREEYKNFYEALWRYLNDTHNGLYQRVEHEFHLVDTEGLSKKEKKEALDMWAQELAQEFITHLVAESLLQQV